MNWLIVAEVTLPGPGTVPQHAIDQAARDLGGTITSRRDSAQAGLFLTVPASREEQAVTAAGPRLAAAARALSGVLGDVQAKPAELRSG